MNTVNLGQSAGDVVFQKASQARHFVDPEEAKLADSDSSFSSLLNKSLNEVNDLQLQYADITQKALVDPDSVNPHDITIAGAEANLALNITKNVLDRVIRAYKEITSLK